MLITLELLQSALDTWTLEKGVTVWQHDQVRRMTASADGFKISGVVQGTRAKPYEQTITLIKQPTRMLVQGYCTCPVGRNCKHVAAILIERASQQRGSDLGDLIEGADGGDVYGLGLESNREGLPIVAHVRAGAEPAERRAVVPVPRLTLTMADVRLKMQHLLYAAKPEQRGIFRLPIARLDFLYDGVLVDNRSTLNTIERRYGDRMIAMPRDLRAEIEAVDRLQALGFRHLGRMPLDVMPDDKTALMLAPPDGLAIHKWVPLLDDEKRFIAFSHTGAPQLSAEGWEIVWAGDYAYRIANGVAQWWADTGAGMSIDWFSFELGVEIEGVRINLVAKLAEILRALPDDVIALAESPETAEAFVGACSALELYYRLPDGCLLPLSGERLAPILKTLIALVGPRAERMQAGKVALHRIDSGLLEHLANGANENVAWSASAEKLLALGRHLNAGFAGKVVQPPAGFNATLRAYQADGLAWLDFLRETGLGGVLADDMGLGKTVQTLAFLAREKVEGRLDRPALIVAPTSVLPNWMAEAERFAPSLSVLSLRGPQRHERFAAIPEHDVVLSTYPLLVRDYEALLGVEFSVAILDEAQAIKNPAASVAMIAHQINARHRFALTGTPLENNLGEVWSLFKFLSPGLLGDERQFRRNFRTPIEKHGDETAQGMLTARLKPFMLRRTKAEVAKELPPKTEIVERISLEGAQRDLYETVRATMHEKVRAEIAKKGLAKSHIVFLEALLKLRQICCDPRLLKMPEARKVKRSAKLERLMEMLPELVADGRRILLFSQFTSMLDLIRTEIEALGIPYVVLTGDTVDRATPVKQFQKSGVPLFLLSLKAGGTGLNLTAADTVIHYDPWWNPAVEAQATDRAHRIGQVKPVFVYKLIVEEGIEEAIELLKARKAALATALFEGAAKSLASLTEADVQMLFAPLPELDRREVRPN